MKATGETEKKKDFNSFDNLKIWTCVIWEGKKSSSTRIGKASNGSGHKRGTQK